MNHGDIAKEICAHADDFLAGVTHRNQARAGMAEWLTINHPKIPPVDRDDIVRSAMRILEQEQFFDADPGGAD